MKTRNGKYLQYRHTFYFHTTGINGKKYTHPVMVKVVAAKKPVTLRLTAADVQRSIGLQGVGNTQTCSMAVCAQRQSQAFPHAVEGFIDWTYSRAYVVSKVNKKTGLPEECVVYRHDDEIAKMNDSAGGQRRLLSDLVASGDRDINLFPVNDRSSGPSGKKKARSAETKTDKPRKRRALSLKGANLRFAVAQLGGIPQ